MATDFWLLLGCILVSSRFLTACSTNFFVCWSACACLVPICCQHANKPSKYCVVSIQAQMQLMVRPNATVAIGYCFGGSAVLDLAASWPSMTDGVQGQSRKAVSGARSSTSYATSRLPYAQSNHLRLHLLPYLHMCMLHFNHHGVIELCGNIGAPLYNWSPANTWCMIPHRCDGIPCWIRSLSHD